MRRELTRWGHRWVLSQRANVRYICVTHPVSERYWYVRPHGHGWRTDTHTLPFGDLDSVLQHLAETVDAEADEQNRMRDAIATLASDDARDVDRIVVAS